MLYLLKNSVYTRLADIDRYGFPVRGGACGGEPALEGAGEVRQMPTEYGLSGWDMTYILPADRELHDRIKKKEEA